MNIKAYAYFFIFLISTSYLEASAESLLRSKRQTAPSNSTATCTVEPELNDALCACIERASEQIKDSYTVEGTTTEEGITVSSGTASGFKSVRCVRPVKCACLKGRVRVFLEVSFIDITITWVVTLLDGLLGGLLGNLGTTLSKLLGNVVNILVKVLALEVNIRITVEQRLVPGVRCRVISYRVTRITRISILNLDLTDLLVNLLGDVLTPVVDTTVHSLLNAEIRVIITREIEKITITSDMFTCVTG